MSEEGNTNQIKMEERSAKALPLPYDLAAVSSSEHAGLEWLFKWRIRASVTVRITGVEH